jgi:hypothetical protein
MQYARILDLIDAEIGRVEKARQLLASCSFTSVRKTQKRKSPPPVRPAVVEIVTVKDFPAVPQAAPPATTIVRPKRARKVSQRERPSRSKPAIATFEKPLAGVVPAAPVFVSAQQIRETHAQKQQMQEAQQSPFGANSKESLSAELLAQRWLHRSA